jgi:hypothetical protein
MRVLAVDVGGNHVKVLASGETEARRFDSGPELAPKRMVRETQEIAAGFRLWGSVAEPPRRAAPQHPGATTEEGHGNSRRTGRHSFAH